MYLAQTEEPGGCGGVCWKQQQGTGWSAPRVPRPSKSVRGYMMTPVPTFASSARRRPSIYLRMPHRQGRKEAKQWQFKKQIFHRKKMSKTKKISKLCENEKRFLTKAANQPTDLDLGVPILSMLAFKEAYQYRGFKYSIKLIKIKFELIEIPNSEILSKTGQVSFSIFK